MVLDVASRHLLMLAPVLLTRSYYSLHTPSLAQECSRLILYFPCPSLWVLFLQGMQLPLAGEWCLETIVCVQVCSFDAGVTQVLFESRASSHSKLLALMLCSCPGSTLMV